MSSGEIPLPTFRDFLADGSCGVVTSPSGARFPEGPSSLTPGPFPFLSPFPLPRFPFFPLSLPPFPSFDPFPPFVPPAFPLSYNGDHPDPNDADDPGGDFPSSGHAGVPVIVAAPPLPLRPKRRGPPGVGGAPPDKGPSSVSSFFTIAIAKCSPALEQ